MKLISFLLALTLTVFGFAACGTTTSEDDPDNPVLIISTGMTFTTSALTATSGATVTIINNDSQIHTITSESAPDAFDDTGDFDATVPALSSGLFTLPSASAGEVFYFYCDIHEGMMLPSTGTITIQ